MRKLPIIPLLGIAIAAIVGFSLGLLFWDDPKVSQVSKVTAQAEPVFAQLEKEIPQKFPEYEVRRTGWTGQRLQGAPLDVPGYEFDISDQAMPGVWIHPKRVNDELLVPTQPIDDVLGFVHQRFVGASFRGISSDSYALNGETCAITQEPGTVLLTVRCEGETLTKALAEQAKPFVDLYLAAHSDLDASDVIYGAMVVRSQNPHGPIGASKTAGYDIAEAVIERNGSLVIALFYSYEGKWHYVTQAQDEFGFSCSDIMRDPHARKAFRHQWCYEYEDDKGLRKLDLNAPTEVI